MRPVNLTKFVKMDLLWSRLCKRAVNDVRKQVSAYVRIPRDMEAQGYVWVKIDKIKMKSEMR